MTEIWKTRKDSDGPSITNSETGDWICIETMVSAEFLVKKLNRLEALQARCDKLEAALPRAARGANAAHPSGARRPILERKPTQHMAQHARLNVQPFGVKRD